MEYQSKVKLPDFNGRTAVTASYIERAYRDYYKALRAEAKEARQLSLV